MKRAARRSASPEIVPSLLAADLAHLARDSAAAARGGAAALHVDVMDGRFVPNITMGQPVVASLRAATKLPLDLHLMIEEPDRYVEDFAKAGADWISVHVEACRHLHRTVSRIRSLGMRAGVAINPATPVGSLEDIIGGVDFVLVMSVNPGFGGQKFITSVIPKVRAVRQMLVEAGRETVHVSVDGGINADTARSVIAAGADVVVAGKFVYGAPDIGAAISSLRAGKASVTT